MQSAARFINKEGRDDFRKSLILKKEIYKDLPVEMFVKDNVNDLTKCLLEQYPKEFDVVNTQKYIDSIYNFSIICNKILKEIKNDNTK